MTKQRPTVGGLGRFGDPGVLVLLSLSAGPRHGHAIIVDVKEQFGIQLGPGTLYGSIAKLVRRGLIAPLPSEDRRRPYGITEAGRAALAEYLETWSKVVQVGNVRLARP
jgi:DNA-binding PadR family transcriptional regulator